MADTITGNPTSNPYTGPIDLSRPHFVGIGGQAMSGLAQLCAQSGSTVTGTEAVDSQRLDVLRLLGCTITVGHSAEAVAGASCVVYTTVAAQTADVIAAREAGIPVIHRAQMLQKMVGDRRLVAVAGSHGKSTTTGILATALTALGEDPTYLIGADILEVGSGARLGTGEVVVAEADESDRAFHFLRPSMAVVTNIEFDHPENFSGLEEVLEAYVIFAARLRHQGTLVVNIDSSAAGRLVERMRRLRPDMNVITYGTDEPAAVQLTQVKINGWDGTAQVSMPNGEPLALRLNTPSRHHLTNAVGALAALVQLGARPTEAVEAVSGFAGLRRRFARVGEAGGVTVIDCYADHQNEIAADLAAARLVAGTHRVHVVFQPSGYTRVKAFAGEMGAALAEGADTTVLLDIRGYSPEADISSALVGDAIVMNGGQVHYVSQDSPADLVTSLADPGDVVVLMGTGDVTALAESILAEFEVNVGQPIG